MGVLQPIPPSGVNPFWSENCYQEQIHRLGHIQSHGVLIGINEQDMTIAQISHNTADFFDISARSLIGKPLITLFAKPQIDILISFLSRKDWEVFNPTKITIQVEKKKYLFQGIMHRSDGLLILELEPLSKTTDSSLSFYNLARSAAANVRRAKDFAEMSELLVQEIRKITQCDRVMLYQFQPDNSGVVIAEAKDNHIDSFLGARFPADDVPPLARELYHKNWLRHIVDVNSDPVPIVPLNNPTTLEVIDLCFSTLRSVAPVHVKYLQKMGVTASFSVSLISAGKLWGLIACHHFSPRYIDFEARKACEFLAQVMSLEIVSKYEQELKSGQEKVRIVQAKLKHDILSANQSINDIFSQGIENLLDLVNAQGVAICLRDRISEIGTCPSQEFISSLILWLDTKSEDVLYTNCLSDLYPEAISIKEIVSGILAISISLNHTSYHIIWFRCEVIQTIDWAGNPSQLALDGEASPQRSFELWKETVKAKSLDWDEVEIETASELRSTLMLAALGFSQQSMKLEAERAQVASQAKSSFLARMSHELRTPLNAILGCTQLMNLDNSLTQDTKEYVNIISFSSEHLLCLIDDILEMSKIEAGKIVLDEVQFDFNLFLHNLREMMQIKAKDKNLQLIFAVHPNTPQFIKADERKIRQILLNLLGNAIKFTDKGYVLLRVSLVDQEESSSKAIIHFELEDSGIGIAPEEVDNLFEAFVQTSSGKDSQSGTGLGLAISQQFAHCMGGHISVSSTLNKGTVFQFDLEVEQLVGQLSNVESEVAINQSQVSISVQPAIKIAEESSKQDISNSLRILLAEDTTYNQIIALKFLEKLGYQADLAVNGLEVLKAIESKIYDLILMDIQMPEMDGLEATRRIRLEEKESMAINRVKIVAMTANKMAEDRENCIQVGMDDFIGKPIKIDELNTVLQKFSGKQTAISR